MHRTRDELDTHRVPASPGGLRQLVESVVFLAIAVTMFRTFAAEGYMISTGSMAPCLLGYHRRVVCPACATLFARGVSIDRETAGDNSRAGSAEALPAASDPASPATAVCPNCGFTSIDTGQIPRNEGDQLLVHKHAYDFRDPRRWEVIVFHNPQEPTQAYVKRVAGLPGETIEIRNGDIYANGQLQRKSLASQCSLRIPVDMHDYPPQDDDPDWRPRWEPDDDTAWRVENTRFLFGAADNVAGNNQPASGAVAAAMDAPTDAAAPEHGDPVIGALQWVRFRHWVRSGGRHHSSVPLAAWPVDVELPNPLFSPLSYDKEMHRLRCVGALPHSELQRKLIASEDGEFRQALRAIYERSHVAPITDDYGYNHPLAADRPYAVRDLMLELTTSGVTGNGIFAMWMTDGRIEFQCAFDFGRREVELRSPGGTAILARGPLPPALLQGPACVSLSLMDRQVLVAVNGELAFAPFAYAESSGPAPPLRRPARFGAQGLQLTVDHVALYRDVYYTAGAAQESRRFVLGPDEFLVLGDNSPVSIDSRSWEHPAVARDLLIGKPFLVHLPSRQGKLQWGAGERYIRIPDFARVRYIR